MQKHKELFKTKIKPNRLWVLSIKRRKYHNYQASRRNYRDEKKDKHSFWYQKENPCAEWIRNPIDEAMVEQTGLYLKHET